MFIYFLVESTDSVYFSEPLGNLTAKENDKSAIFECRLSSVVPDVAWRYRSGSTEPEKTLRNDQKHQILSEGTRQYLRICDVKSSDTGQYSCVVDYEGAEGIKTSALLVVSGKNLAFVNKRFKRMSNILNSLLIACLLFLQQLQKAF